MKHVFIRNMIIKLAIAFMTVSISSVPIYAASANEIIQNLSDENSIGEKFPADISKLQIAEEKDTAEVTDIFISGADKPAEGLPLDTEADVSAQVKGTKTEWQIPIIWLDKQGNITETFSQDCMPVLVFFIPDNPTFDGFVELESNLADMLGKYGNILVFTQEKAGVFYITGDLTLFLTDKDASRKVIVKNRRKLSQLSENTKQDDIPPVPAADDPVLPVPSPQPEPEPEPEPEDTRTPMEIFADKYKGNYRNIDWAAEEENLGGDLTAVDWSELIRLIGYKDYETVEMESGLAEYYDTKCGKEGEFYRVFPIIFSDASEEFLLEHWERAYDAPESIIENVSEDDFEMVFGLYDHDDLENLIDVIVNRIQPKAVELLVNNIPAFKDADADAFSPSVGLQVCYSMMDISGMVAADYGRGQEIGYQMTLTLENINSEYDREDELEHIDTENLGNIFLGTIVHENMHLIMYDYNRPLIDNYNGINMEYSAADGITYSVPGYGNMNITEKDALINAVSAPKWFIEGIATAMGGYYADFNEYYHAAAQEESGKYNYDQDLISAHFSSEVGNLNLLQMGNRSQYTYGSLAVIYLGEMALRHENKTAVTRNEDGSVACVDSQALREGISEILKETHDGTTLDDVIARISNGTFADTEDFGQRYIAGDENGKDTESAQFTADLLNYLEQLSAEKGEPVSGSVLLDFADSIYDVFTDDDVWEKDIYNFTDSADYTQSTVSTEMAATQAGKSDFDLEEYREEQNNVQSDEEETGETVQEDDP